MRCVYILPVLAAVLYALQGSWGAFAIWLIPHVPAQYLHNAIANTADFLGAVNSKFESLGLKEFPKCFNGNKDEELLVLAAGSKGGSAFVVQLGLEIMNHCGLTYGFGRKLLSDWPPAPEVPPLGHKYNLYIAAANPYRWPEYAKSINATKIKCVVLTRDPYTRFMSMYKYSRDGGESGLKGHAAYMNDMKTTKQRLEYMWDFYGKSTMLLSHKAIMDSVKNPLCTQIKFEEFMKGGDSFNAASRKLLEAFGVNKDVEEALVEAFKPMDISQGDHSHKSGKSIDAQEVAEVKKLLAESKDMMDIINSQKKDLGYK